MKKKLVASLAAAMVLGVAGTSFAAANPFVDVPAKHWAYASVTKLAQAGIVDGYSDGQFAGDKMISRYEMAQIVAKAMAKADKADAAQKAELDKLEAEFSDELDKLGVRVTKLEAKQSNLKFTGDLRVRWNNTADRANAAQFKDRFRLNMTSQINDNTSLYARFVFQDDKFNQDTNQRLTDMALTTKNLIKNTDITVGRYTLNMGPTTSLSGTTGDLDGIMTNSKYGNTTVMLGYAQARNTAPGSLIVNGLNIKNIAFAEATHQFGKAKVAADYFKNIDVGSSDGNGSTVKDAYNIAGGSLVYTFDKNVKVIGEYYKNTAKDAKTLYGGSAPTATVARVQYKGASAANPGSFGFFLENNKFEGNALPYAFQGPFHRMSGADVGLAADGLKSWVAQVDYTLAKNITFNALHQFNIKDAKTGVDGVSKTYDRVQVNYMF
ncbi:S-layer homology domain-containing protein [Pelosinus sp. sgz500959]|uniref:S-layer homology domain-containing protein n=1 Tax=Pelosinus sp. sgz500959 TaxID=3242472 RepID=UPI00366FD1BB